MNLFPSIPVPSVKSLAKSLGGMNWMTRTARILHAQCSLRYILGAWSEETKQQITEKQIEKGVSLVTHVVVEEFDLVLWQTPIRDFPFYFVTLNVGQYDPFDQGTIESTVPQEKQRGYKDALERIVTTLVNWVDEYGRIAVGSSNVRKRDRYMSILFPLLQKYGVEVEPIRAEEPALGSYLTR